MIFIVPAKCTHIIQSSTASYLLQQHIFYEVYKNKMNFTTFFFKKCETPVTLIQKMSDYFTIWKQQKYYFGVTRNAVHSTFAFTLWNYNKWCMYK